MNTPEPPPLPEIQFPPGMEAIYANLVRIAHSPAELVMDFARMLPGDSHPQVCTRVLMSPIGAKLFLNALSENLAKYEAAFGEIRLPGDNSLASDLFRTIRPPDSPPNG